MRSTLEIRHRRRGVTLAESLVVLTVLALAAATLLSARPRSNDALDAAKRTAFVAEQIAQARLRAIREGSTEVVEIDASCAEGPETVTVYTDGTAKGGPLCFGEMRYALDPLDAGLIAESEQ